MRPAVEDHNCKPFHQLINQPLNEIFKLCWLYAISLHARSNEMTLTNFLLKEILVGILASTMTASSV